MSVDREGGGVGSVRPLEVGETLDTEALGSLVVTSVTQRNWSRVARVESDDTVYFAKQFVDRVQRPHERGFNGDYEVMAALGDEVCPGVSVVPVLDRFESRLVVVSPQIDMRTIDSIGRGLRSDVERAGQVGRALRTILEERTMPDDPTSVSVWKGLDPKNIGWTETGALWIFDFGPAAVLPRSTAAARVMAAGLLCRWVARAGIHLVWPERDILRAVCEPLADLTELEQVEHELAKHAALRLREPQRTGLAASATKLGLRTLGRVHWAAVQREARRLYAEG